MNIENQPEVNISQSLSVERLQELDREIGSRFSNLIATMQQEIEEYTDTDKDRFVGECLAKANFYQEAFTAAARAQQFDETTQYEFTSGVQTDWPGVAAAEESLYQFHRFCNSKLGGDGHEDLWEDTVDINKVASWNGYGSELFKSYHEILNESGNRQFDLERFELLFDGLYEQATESLPALREDYRKKLSDSGIDNNL